jgi:hypothetical protein
VASKWEFNENQSHLRNHSKNSKRQIGYCCELKLRGEKLWINVRNAAAAGRFSVFIVSVRGGTAATRTSLVPNVVGAKFKNAGIAEDQEKFKRRN